MYSGVEYYVVCCYSECISHTRQAEKSAWPRWESKQTKGRGFDSHRGQMNSKEQTIKVAKYRNTRTDLTS